MRLFRGLYLPIDFIRRRRAQASNSITTPIGVYVPVNEAFPDVHNDFETLKSLLQQLSRTDTLFWCSRLNLIVSNPKNADHKAKQQYGLSVMFASEDIARINRFTNKHGGAEKVTIFFRGQLLELLRWACLICRDLPDDGRTFENRETCRTFAQAALIASDLWSSRIGRDNLSIRDGLDESRRRVLNYMRQAHAGVSPGLDPLLALGRGWSLFSDYFPQIYSNFEREFQSRTGISLQECHTCLCMMMTHYLNITPETATNTPAKLGIFDLKTFHSHVSPSMKTILDRYIDLESQTADQLRLALWGPRGMTNEGDAGPFNPRPLRMRPILRASDGRAIIMDPIFYAEKGAIAPLFYLVGDDVSQDKANVIFGAFGKSFERYANDILKRMFPEVGPPLVNRLTCNLEGLDRAGNTVEIADACLNNVTEVIIFEMKAVWIREDIILSGDFNKYLDYLQYKYVQEKGIGQLARSITKLADNEWTPKGQDFRKAKRVYPVLIVHDPLLDASLYPWFLASEFKSALAPDGTSDRGSMRKGPFKVAPLIVMTIEDLETLETSIEHFSLCDLLRDYSKECPDRFVSLHNFISLSGYGQKMYSSRSVASKSLEILRKTAETMFPTKS